MIQPLCICGCNHFFENSIGDIPFIYHNCQCPRWLPHLPVEDLAVTYDHCNAHLHNGQPCPRPQAPESYFCELHLTAVHWRYQHDLATSGRQNNPMIAGQYELILNFLRDDRTKELVRDAKQAVDAFYENVYKINSYTWGQADFLIKVANNTIRPREGNLPILTARAHNEKVLSLAAAISPRSNGSHAEPPPPPDPLEIHRLKLASLQADNPFLSAYWTREVNPPEESREMRLWEWFTECTHEEPAAIYTHIKKGKTRPAGIAPFHIEAENGTMFLIYAPVSQVVARNPLTGLRDEKDQYILI